MLQHPLLRRVPLRLLTVAVLHHHKGALRHGRTALLLRERLPQLLLRHALLQLLLAMLLQRGLPPLVALALLGEDRPGGSSRTRAAHFGAPHCPPHG